MSSPQENYGVVAPRSFERCELVLFTIDTVEKPKLTDIVEAVRIPKRSIHAIFARLSEQHRVVISRVNGRRHGFYKILDWGNLDRAKVLQHITNRIRESPHMQELIAESRLMPRH